MAFQPLVVSTSLWLEVEDSQLLVLEPESEVEQSLLLLSSNFMRRCWPGRFSAAARRLSYRSIGTLVSSSMKICSSQSVDVRDTPSREIVSVSLSKLSMLAPLFVWQGIESPPADGRVDSVGMALSEKSSQDLSDERTREGF